MENQEQNYLWRIKNMQPIFQILFLIGNPGKISKGEKAFLRVNLICYISGTEGRRKLKFSTVGLQIFHIF